MLATRYHTLWPAATAWFAKNLRYRTLICLSVSVNIVTGTFAAEWSFNFYSDDILCDDRRIDLAILYRYNYDCECVRNLAIFAAIGPRIFRFLAAKNLQP